MIGAGMELFLVSRNLERVADLATNIGEDVVFLVEGQVDQASRRGDPLTAEGSAPPLPSPPVSPRQDHATLQVLPLREQADEHQPGHETADVGEEGGAAGLV